VKDVRAASAGDTISPAAAAAPSRLADYLALTKPRLNFLVVASSAAGYYLGTAARPDPVDMAAAVAGTTMVAGGAAVLNQLFERETDGLMRRTRWRPLPDGRVSPTDAAMFGTVLSVAGLALLAVRANLLAAALALATIVIYLAIYTPLKRRTPYATLVGAIPGALPPVIGWATSTGAIGVTGATLFAIVFLWQIPHFMAISWLYRDDYAQARFPMLSVIDVSGRRASREALIYAAALVPVSLVPVVIGTAGSIYAAIAAVLGLSMLVLAVRFARRRDDQSARLLFFASITYLPLLWIALIANRL
jgi:heme o synthase